MSAAMQVATRGGGQHLAVKRFNLFGAKIVLMAPKNSPKKFSPFSAHTYLKMDLRIY